MSLVAYGSSDESENEDEIHEEQEVNNVQQNVKNCIVDSKIDSKDNSLGSKSLQNNDVNINNNKHLDNDSKLDLKAIPKPKLIPVNNEEIQEEIDDVPCLRKVNYSAIEKPPKKKREPVRITIPSLSEFKDLDSGNSQNANKATTSGFKSSLLAMLPQPRNLLIGKNNSMVPNVIMKKENPSKPITPVVQKKPVKIVSNKSNSKPLIHYDSNSDDEQESEQSGTDFFSLTSNTVNVTTEAMGMENLDLDIPIKENIESVNESKQIIKEENDSDMKLVSTVMDLPREEVLLKNKVEVGPKLPIPEQEYNIDSQGNVAFDDKAIEYLCGRRGIKRKNELSNIDIVEISGEDIKPDERDWLVKALTEEPQRMSTAGPSGLSKKKHQITYLAHQAKAMELELKNQWAESKANRQQSRAKYGF